MPNILFTLLLVCISNSNSHGQLVQTLGPRTTTATIVNFVSSSYPPTQLVLKDSQNNGSTSANVTTPDQITSYLKNAMQNYDKRLRPDFFGPPTKVGVTLLVGSIASINEVDMEFQADMKFRQIWRDTRLAYNFPGIDEISLSNSFIDDIWTPDTSFRNGKEAYLHDALVPNKLIRIYPNGTIMMSTRLTLTAACPMSLKLYPFDFQVCGFEAQSYGYTTDKLQYYFKGGVAGVEISLDSATLPQYEVRGYRQHSRTETTLTGQYDTLGIGFLFVRSINHYVAQIYLPTFLIVVISYMGLWIDRENAESRLALAVTSVLTMTAAYLALSTTGPPVNYIKAVDVYLGFCFLCVFTTLLESVVIAYLMKKMKEARKEAKENDLAQNHSEGHSVKIERHPGKNGDYELKCKRKAARVDKACRIVFPILFVIFHVAYFAYYLNSSQLTFEEHYWTLIQ